EPSRVLPLSMLPMNFCGMPPTGPMVPSGLMMPVMVALGSIDVPISDARKPAVIRPDALAPSTLPPAPAEKRKSVRSLPSVVAATYDAIHTPARHCPPAPPAYCSNTPTETSPSGLGDVVSLTGLEPPLVG